jgi:hypothetical protein
MTDADVSTVIRTSLVATDKPNVKFLAAPSLMTGVVGADNMPTSSIGSGK